MILKYIGALAVSQEAIDHILNLDITLSALRDAITAASPNAKTLKDLYDQLVLIKASLDKLPSDPAREGGNLSTLAGKDFATQTTLALIKEKTDNLDTALSGIKTGTDKLPPDPAREGGNLATLAGKDFATQTTLALIKAKTDNLNIQISALRDAITGTSPDSKTLKDIVDSLTSILTELQAKTEPGDTQKVQEQNPITNYAQETGGNLATIAGKDFATENTLKNNLEAITSLVSSKYDYISFVYTGENLTSLVFKLGGSSGTIVSILTLEYDVNDNLISVTKS